MPPRQPSIVSLQCTHTDETSVTDSKSTTVERRPNREGRVQERDDGEGGVDEEAQVGLGIPHERGMEAEVESKVQQAERSARGRQTTSRHSCPPEPHQACAVNLVTPKSRARADTTEMMVRGAESVEEVADETDCMGVEGDHADGRRAVDIARVAECPTDETTSQFVKVREDDLIAAKKSVQTMW